MKEKSIRPNLEDTRHRCAPAGLQCKPRKKGGPARETVNELKESWDAVKDRAVILQGNHVDLKGNLIGKNSTGNIFHPDNFSKAAAIKPANSNLPQTDVLTEDVEMEETGDASPDAKRTRSLFDTHSAGQPR